MKPPPIYLTFLVAGVFFMENIDGTIIATALPQMGRSFQVSAVDLNVGMTAYMLTLAVFIPISGWAADRVGSRSIFATAIGIFTLSSVGCGLSHTLLQFTFMRVLQGVGGAMMVPVGRLIVLRVTEQQKLTTAINYITWPGLMGLVLGPPIGGFVTTYTSWHWIFFLNFPIGILALALALLWVENVRASEKHPFDWLTFFFAGLASSGILYAMEKLGQGNHWHIALMVLALSILSGLLAFLAARNKPTTSFIDLELLKLKSYSLFIYGGGIFRVAVSVLPFLLPLMFQIAFGWSPFRSGLYLLALFGGDLSMKAFVIQALRRFGFRTIIIFNGALTAASILLCGMLSTSTPSFVILPILLLHGACRSLEFTCLTTLAYSQIPTSGLGRANSFLSTVQQLGNGLGVAVGAATLRLIAHWRGHSTSVPQLRDFHSAFIVMAALSLGPVLDSIGLSRDAGASISGHSPSKPELDLVSSRRGPT